VHHRRVHAGKLGGDEDLMAAEGDDSAARRERVAVCSRPVLKSRAVPQRVSKRCSSAFHTPPKRR
jgi:hypothetical protein